MLALILLVIHITAGSIALLTAFVALVTAKGGVIHIRAGRVYAIGMTVIFLTAVPLAALGANVFLLLIAFFSSSVSTWYSQGCASPATAAGARNPWTGSPSPSWDSLDWACGPTPSSWACRAAVNG